MHSKRLLPPSVTNSSRPGGAVSGLKLPALKRSVELRTDSGRLHRSWGRTSAGILLGSRASIIDGSVRADSSAAQPDTRAMDFSNVLVNTSMSRHMHLRYQDSERLLLRSRKGLPGLAGRIQ